MTIADEIKKMSDVDVLEHAAMEFISQVDAIRKSSGDPSMQNQLAGRLHDLAARLSGFTTPKESEQD